jgi:predicted nuclease with TOPRIM domain
MYIIFTNWFNVAKDVFTANVLNPEMTEQYRKEVFNSRIFGTYERLDWVDCLNEIKELEKQIADNKAVTKPDELTVNEKENKDYLNSLQKQLASYRKAVDRYYDEFYVLELYEYLFEKLDYEKITNFINAFNVMFKESTSENLSKLEYAFSAVDVGDTLQKMKNQLNVFNVNK